MTAEACGLFGRRPKLLARAMHKAPDASREMIELVALRVSEPIAREIKDGLNLTNRAESHNEKATLIRDANAAITFGQS